MYKELISYLRYCETLYFGMQLRQNINTNDFAAAINNELIL